MSRKCRILLLVSGLFTLAMGLSGVFVNIFLWKKTNNFISIAGYNLMHYIFVPVSFVLAGYISKRKNGIWPLRFGIIGFVMFYGVILLLNDNVTKFIYPLGILFGIASGFYWLAFNVLSFDFTDINNRDSFNGFNGCACGICNAAGPISAAYIIDRFKGTGYTIVFAISLGLFSVLLIVSMFLRTEKYGKRLSFRMLIKDHNREWARLRRATIAWGFRDVVIAYLITILIFQTTGSELSVGKLSFFASLLSSASFIIEQKIIKPNKRVISMTLGAFIVFIAVWGLVVKVNFYTLLSYIVLDAVFLPFFLVPLSSATFNVIDENHEKDLRVEYAINKEIVLNSGRIASTIILMGLLYFIKYERVLNYFLLFIGAGPVFALYFLKKMELWEK